MPENTDPPTQKPEKLIAKLILFLVLGALVGVISGKARKARNGDAEVHLRAMTTVGRLAMLTALGAVVLAVLMFQ